MRDSTPEDYGRAFLAGIVLNVIFVIAEAVFGLLAQSLALLADAAHNLSDVLSLLLAWGATLLARRLPTQRHTYGLRRSSIVAALVNSLILLVAVGGIGWEAIRRIGDPEPTASATVIWVAAAGVAINGATAWFFRPGRTNDLNVRSAFLHMIADAAISLGVVLAGFGILFTGWLWLDPAASLMIVVVIVIGTWSLLRESLHLTLDGVPAHIDTARVEDYLAKLPGVIAVHDLHIWGMSTTETALTVHLVKPDASIDDALLNRINRELRERFGIDHTTVQFELGDETHPCKQAPAHVV